MPVYRTGFAFGGSTRRALPEGVLVMSHISSQPPGVILVRRLHLYIGLFIGPFLLLAALTGIAYALTPQLEAYLYASVLRSEHRGEPLPLAEQLRSISYELSDSTTLTALRPPAVAGDITRVVLRMPNQPASQQRALFIDPVTGQKVGELTVQGDDGVLPLRAWLRRLHQNLLMGEGGRLYCELAASWLWVAALGGLYLARARKSRQEDTIVHEHICLGLILAAALVFFSLTGLGGSRYAGERLQVLGQYLGWVERVDEGKAPSRPKPSHSDMSYSHSGAVDPVMFDRVLQAARVAGLDAAELEIRPPASAGQTWTVSEIRRRWPTRSGTVSLDAQTLEIVKQQSSDQQPWPTRVLRWSVDAHTGVLFGLANQVLLLIVGAGIVFMVFLGYLLCWQRRLDRSASPTLVEAWRACTPAWQTRLLLLTLLLGLALPLLGISLLLFIGCEMFKIPAVFTRWSKS
ncbi:PepSY domain-containing protein [Pseudomonas syringae]|nr:PepSY domain-containing protein [Pseudomonas syringae]MBD8803191.1 PepSY domain-containing protein [Pseudomonas syringae]MBD8814011.1 PepSY domain-containing protein [Pseudomonas syringae]